MFTTRRSANGVKERSCTIQAAGKIPATRFDLDRWTKTLPLPWTAAMEGTVAAALPITAFAVCCPLPPIVKAGAASL
jgi:hypothetical protein